MNMQTRTMHPPAFAEKVIEELGIEHLPSPAQAEFVARIGGQIMKRLAIAVHDTLDETKRAEEERLIAGGDEEGLLRFYAESVPDFDTLVADVSRRTVAEFKILYQKEFVATAQ